MLNLLYDLVWFRQQEIVVFKWEITVCCFWFFLVFDLILLFGVIDVHILIYSLLFLVFWFLRLAQFFYQSVTFALVLFLWADYCIYCIYLFLVYLSLVFSPFCFLVYQNLDSVLVSFPHLASCVYSTGISVHVFLCFMFSF